MNDQNAYAPPMTDIRTSSDGSDGALSGMSTKELTKLYNASRNISALVFLWCMGLGLFAFGTVGMLLGAGSKPTETGPMVIGVLITVLYGFVVYGCWNRLTWGRTLGQVVCALSLIGIPIGTIIGIVGLIAFSNGARLFGPDRLTYQAIKAEVKARKASGRR